ncbi:phosphoinositide-3-kinase catalytic gamma polypeptide [Salpingoeca rosetta]|uniref:Phosphoinositide-3-kinase catalytic gamma polypeptide n=1 Tax=Salpingoeca rosetta (strain ATCC 50818 / BSB-021) TaxID=946362 RepID=F2UM86_SALR5|nr:phosphoinositide-3-kinase catalytic gamma polypeptide [Salpingoeca rosetta]EGD78235.1 phosphoinositide-3-kinase catalytic gamma polypeptide [Salpingoeca rosetta]|eukprot:XP_004989558.1 phosphoinositide-3-kinase catalytic gamma polypeptide [Salpingoeca rosetta]
MWHGLTRQFRRDAVPARPSAPTNAAVQERAPAVTLRAPQQRQRFNPAISMVGEEEEEEEEEEVGRGRGETGSTGAVYKGITATEDDSNYDASIVVDATGKMQVRLSYTHPGSIARALSSASSATAETQDFSAPPADTLRSLFQTFRTVSHFTTADQDVHDLKRTLQRQLTTDDIARPERLENNTDRFRWTDNEQQPLSITVCVNDQSAMFTVPATATFATVAAEVQSHMGVDVHADTHVFKLAAAAETFDLNSTMQLCDVGAFAVVLNNVALGPDKQGIPIVLRVITKDSLPRPFAGAVHPDTKFVPIVAPPETVHLNDLLHTLREKADELRIDTASANVKPFVQAVRALSFAAGELELKELSRSIQTLTSLENTVHDMMKVEAVLSDVLRLCEEMVAIFRKAASPRPPTRSTVITMAPEELTDCFSFRVDSLHRLPQAWLATFPLFRVQVGLYYGDALIAPMIPLMCSHEPIGQFFRTVFWKHDDWIETNSLLYRHLPLETRIVCLVDGATADNGITWQSLGWASIPLYDHHRVLSTGPVLLRLNENEQRGPHLSSNDVVANQAPFLLFRLREFDRPVLYRALPHTDRSSPSKHATAGDGGDGDGDGDGDGERASLGSSSSSLEADDSARKHALSTIAEGDEEDEEDARGSSRASKQSNTSGAATGGFRISNLPAPASALLEDVDVSITSPLLQTYVSLYDLVSPPLGFLSLYRGADVHILSQDGDIWTGSLADSPDTQGKVQSSHLSSLPKPPEPLAPPQHTPQTDQILGHCRAMFSFTGEGDAALSFEMDDVIAIRAKEGVWWFGDIEHRTGWFPASYVEMMPALKPEPTMNERKVVTHDFASKSSHDLDLETGEDVVVIHQYAGWCYGQQGDEEGWFPATHVSEPEEEDPLVYEATYNYEAKYEDELTLSLGATVFILQQPEGGWWQGKCNDRIGWFPSNYVKPKESASPTAAKRASTTSAATDTTSVPSISVSMSSTAEAPTPTKVPPPKPPPPNTSSSQQPASLSLPSRSLHFVASYRFTARNMDELSFDVGQPIVVVKQPDGGWWYGRVEDREGWFPSNHVRPATIDVSSAAERSSFKAVAAQAQAIIRHSTLDRLSPADRKMIWMFRRDLQGDARALPRVVQAIPVCHTPTLVEELEALILSWAPPSPLQALELLQQSFADRNIRAAAVTWIERMDTSAFAAILPQLVQAVKFELFHCNELSMLLVRRAGTSPRIAMQLFWTLRCEADNQLSGARYQLLLDQMLAHATTGVQRELAWQVALVARLKSVHRRIAAISGSEARKKALSSALTDLAGDLPARFHLPLDACMQVSGIKAQRCSFFTSNAIPLRLVFNNADEAGGDVECIFKCGDDLRQDTLVMQLVQFLHRTWLDSGLNLHMITFRIRPTDATSGFIEMIKNAKTLREIHTRHGSVTGSFNDRLLHEWLRQNNASPEQWRAAHNRFMRSCAGYCVATYLLGVCDRHNDNIMITRDGRLFHIDFGRFLRHAQKFGPINRDRVPFVLTSDMAYVINEGDKPTPHFQTFVDLCCQAYNIARAHGNTLLSLMMLMLQAGIPELQSKSDLVHVQDALKLNDTDEAAMAHFTKMIQTSLSSKFTKINFFFHNLGQMRSSNASKGPVLSFSPHTGDPKTEARIVSAEIVEFQKRYDLDKNKFYMYMVRVERVDGSVTFVYRRYSEFNELHQKLLSSVDDTQRSSIPSFPSKIYVGRSHTRQVALKRMRHLNQYMRVLLAMDDAVVHTPLVYTFFCPTPRDEVDNHNAADELGADASSLPAIPGFGQVQLTVRYDPDEHVLTIHVHHARGLRPPPGTQSPGPYVKVHVLPSRSRDMKRKTSAQQNTVNPTFNETLTYKDVDVEQIASTALEVGVWTRDYGSKATCMGVVQLNLSDPSFDLGTGTPRWFTLEAPTPAATDA